MAKAKGISLNITKQGVIDLPDELEPGLDHSALKGKALIAAKKKHHIGPLKNKQQLIKALQKSAGEELAGKAKQGKEEKWLTTKLICRYEAQRNSGQMERLVSPLIFHYKPGALYKEKYKAIAIKNAA